LSTPRAFHSLLGTLRRTEWVVYSKPPFGGPEHVLKYLARYTHRVAISNGRLLSLDNGQVRFRWRDSRHNNRSSVMTLDAIEFIRRFLLHALPTGFVKIRHFGLLANRNRRQAAGSLQDSSPPHGCRSKLVANRTTEVCAQPVMPSVQMRYSACRRALFHR